MPIKKRNIKDIGELNREITFQSLVYSQDTKGHSNEVFSNVTGLVDVWAKVEDDIGTRVFIQDRHYENLVDKKFTVRHNTKFTDIIGTPNYYIKYNGRRYKIMNAVNVGESNRYMEFKGQAMDLEVT